MKRFYIYIFHELFIRDRYAKRKNRKLLGGSWKKNYIYPWNKITRFHLSFDIKEEEIALRDYAFKRSQETNRLLYIKGWSIELKKKKEKKKKRKASKISRKIQKMGCWKEREEEDKKNFPFYRSNLRDKPSLKRSHVDFHRRSFIRGSGKVSSVRNRFLGEEDKKKENGEDKGRRQALGDLLNTPWWRWCAQTFAILYSSSFKGRIRIVLEEQERT